MIANGWEYLPRGILTRSATTPRVILAFYVPRGLGRLFVFPKNSSQFCYVHFSIKCSSSKSPQDLGYVDSEIAAT